VELDPNQNTASAQVEVDLIKQKLFVDEMFGLNKLGSGQILPPNPQHYDIRQNNANEKFLSTVF